MTILLTGGGSGGHITPILAVADELKQRQPDLRLVYIGQHGDKFADIAKNHEQINKVYLISAGKFRRYHGEKWRLILDLKTNWLNFRDFWRFARGTIQSYRLIKKLKPSVIFVKGGFVSVPVALAAAWCKIPYITHDSDAIPGLANRLIARWAVAHAVAMPVEVYKYPKVKTHYVGVPVGSLYKRVTPQLQTEYRRGLKIPTDAKVLCVTGGGLGADRLNRAVVEIADQLLEHYPNLYLIHIAGRGHDDIIKRLYSQALKPAEKTRLIVKGFVSDLYAYSAAADLIITRAGATTLAEFALQQRACIVVPNPILTGGHQTKNAEYLAQKQAVKLISEAAIKTDGVILFKAVRELLDSSDRRQQLADRLGLLAKADSAAKLADLILELTK